MYAVLRNLAGGARMEPLKLWHPDTSSCLPFKCARKETTTRRLFFDKFDETTFFCDFNCVDYRKRSDVTRKEAQPVFGIDEIADMLAAAKWFSTLDFASSYWQPHSVYTTFMSCRSGCATLLRLFDDLSELQRDLNWKLCCLLGRYFNLWEDGQRASLASTAVLQRLKDGGSKLNIDKCHLLQSSVEFLGHLDLCIGLKFVAGRPQSHGAVERLNASLKKNWRFGCVKITAQSGLWVCNLSSGKSTSALNTT
ncbi:Retrovirus-related Pol polyprotein from transposon 17.6 [Trichinella zimbabwensis]|uniref:Retrovirus-related Pol polyprotein from transposon 17.6 n=1 Tax=Trichinella zimbabwensis TaxID=268475 RepID=A0A0V1I093_9BILA|nr:Retrovirus-related Pol polyprotein from transposon 17.6 [Trichinella zimbabwensis]